MVTELWGIWTLGDETTASVYLAVSLLQGASLIVSRFVPFGELACLLEILLGAATAVMGASGILMSFGRDVCNVDASPIGENTNYWVTIGVLSLLGRNMPKSL